MCCSNEISAERSPWGPSASTSTAWGPRRRASHGGPRCVDCRVDRDSCGRCGPALAGKPSKIDTLTKMIKRSSKTSKIYACFCIVFGRFTVHLHEPSYLKNVFTDWFREHRELRRIPCAVAVSVALAPRYDLDKGGGFLGLFKSPQMPYLDLPALDLVPIARSRGSISGLIRHSSNRYPRDWKTEQN